MSYYCNCVYSDLAIKAEAIDMAIMLLTDERHPGRCDAKYLTQPAADTWPENVKRLYGLLDEWGIDHDTMPPAGDTVAISRGDGKWHLEDEELFAAIATVVRDGGVIAFAGEDGRVWRYRYRDGEVFENDIDFTSDEGWV